ncbi:hypothetical protein [Parasitella parasitica]|uniref:N-acetyltransferase domain-containing protein n=1 Tax=Parasitella parasitica TaxID=35722 RepID=A0A0B7NEU8_9FUNG|nr:hypothetical protein [Parasitella parasitica]
MVRYTNVSVRQLDFPKGIDDALKVRIAVFVEEQKYTLESELDNHDEGSYHWAAYCDKENEDGSIEKNVPVGTIRMIPKPGNIAKLGRLAVLNTARGLYIGQLLVKELIDFCKKNDYHTIVLHSQYPRRGFYAKLGFVIEQGEEIFSEDGTPHIRMFMRNI